MLVVLFFCHHQHYSCFPSLISDWLLQVNEGWAEPVLEYIKRHRNTIVQPAVDDIDQWNINYEANSEQTHDAKWRGVFLWDMR